MARKYLVPIDLSKNELQNAAIQNLATPPASPVEGQVYYDTDTNIVYFWNGTEWVSTQTDPYSYAAAGETTDVTITATESNGTSANLARADHQHAGPGFGSPSSLSFGGSASDGTATTVSHSDHVHQMPAHDASAHSTIKLSDLAAPSADLSIGTHKLTNVVDPTSAQDAATKNYVDTRKVTDLTAPTSDFSMNSHKITNLADPVNPSDAANKSYVDGAIAGLDWKTSVNLLSTTNVPLTGSTGLVIDSHDPLGDADDGYRILLTGQSTAADNGIYVYTDNGTTYTLTRAEDANQYQELINASVFVSEGTLYGKTSWVQANHYLTSFSGQEWVQFGGANLYVAGDGLQLTGNSFSLKPVSDGGLQADGTGASIKLQTNSGLGTTSNGLAVGAGTGISVSTGTVSIDTSVVARKYSVAVGDTTNTSFTVTHNLGTRDVNVSVRETGGAYAQVEADVAMTTTNTVTVSFAVAPSSNQYTVTVIG